MAHLQLDRGSGFSGNVVMSYYSIVNRYRLDYIYPEYYDHVIWFYVINM